MNPPVDPAVDARPFGVPPQRTPVQYDPTTGGLRIGAHERTVDPSVPSQVYSAYLSLLYAVRGSKPGTTLPLRGADLEALLLIVGDDPDTIEARLIGLMGCTADEASALGGLLLRHRRSMAALGIAAGLAVGLAGALDPGAGSSSDGPARGAASSSGDVAQAVVAQPDVAQPAVAQPAAAPAGVALAAPVTGVASVLLAGLDAPVRTASDDEPFALPVRGGVGDSPAPVEATAVSAAAPAEVTAVAPQAGVEAGTAGAADGLPVMDAPPPPPEPADAQVGDAISLFEDVLSDGAAPPAAAPADTAGSADRVAPGVLPEGAAAISGTTSSDDASAHADPEGAEAISGTTSSDDASAHADPEAEVGLDAIADAEFGAAQAAGSDIDSSAPSASESDAESGPGLSTGGTDVSAPAGGSTSDVAGSDTVPAPGAGTEVRGTATPLHQGTGSVANAAADMQDVVTSPTAEQDVLEELLTGGLPVIQGSDAESGPPDAAVTDSVATPPITGSLSDQLSPPPSEGMVIAPAPTNGTLPVETGALPPTPASGTDPATVTPGAGTGPDAGTTPPGKKAKDKDNGKDKSKDKDASQAGG